MVSALKMLGFNKVFDTDFAADLTIIEEGNELLSRIKNGGILPMITSCSPGWINYAEGFYPELLDHLSTCKSPQQMFGAMAKTYYAKKSGINPEDIFTVSIMPCTAKKYECKRPEMNSSGYRDVDVALTTRELARLIKNAGIDFNNIEDEDFDSIMGASTGAVVIFGATDYTFIEIMSCTGGCAGGGGQPVGANKSIKSRRIHTIYNIDKEMPIRKSHENPEVKQLYEEFLGEPNGHLAHELLHTHYHQRSKN